MTPEPLILAIETSQRSGSVAVRDRGAVAHVERLHQQLMHNDDLLPAIDRLLTRLGLGPDDLRGGAVGVSIGPGGFTGLRIAVSTAKMLAEALRVRLVAVPSAVVAAYSYMGSGPVMVALASKRETVWATRLRREAERWIIDDPAPPGLVDATSMTLHGIEAVLADEHLPASAAARCRDAGVPVVAPLFDAAACLAATMPRLQRGQITDPLALLPLYPREPEAVTLWRQRAKA